MRIRWERFNTYLIPLLAMALVVGCESMEKKRKKQEALLRIHLEARSDEIKLSDPVPIYRAQPIMIRVQRAPFVTEENVKHAKLVETVGGFGLQLEFNRSGRYLLEQYTAANRERRLVIFAEFPCPTNLDLQVSRWLAAPKISQRITDGMLTFTPDASRQEVDQLAIGLNNVAKRLETGKEPYD
jgi:hypothetical protein